MRTGLRGMTVSLWLSPPKCPVDSPTQAWIDQRMGWLAGQYGMEMWRMARAVEPTDEFFPDRYDGTEAAVQNMLNRVCGFFKVDAKRVVLRLYLENRGIRAPVGSPMATTGSAGRYEAGEKETVAIETSNLGDDCR